MKAAVCAMAAVALAVPATAENRYDRKLEEAAAAIIASKIGEIRGGFAFGVKPAMVVVRDDVLMSTTDIGAAAPAPPEGMARATERRAAPSTTF
jgi:hypothetical protein